MAVRYVTSSASRAFDNLEDISFALYHAQYDSQPSIPIGDPYTGFSVLAARRHSQFTFSLHSTA
ncbi:MAG TPA: hypothetical protein VHK01_13890, partial [Lacipirellulaceae bacterium]|nr:hypothetical protein [Lacipirellulaceae bacterium]